MKKIFKILCMMSFIFIICISEAKADTGYTIEVPSTFKKDKTKDYWQKEVDNEKISILIYTTNNSNKLNLKDVVESDIDNDKYLDALKLTFKELGYNITSYSSTLKKTTLNNYPSIVIDVDSKYTLESKTPNIVYQRQYVLTSENYIYYIIISSSSKQHLNKKEITNILNSFKITDDLIDSKDAMIKYYIALGGIIVLGIVIAFVFSKKK